MRGSRFAVVVAVVSAFAALQAPTANAQSGTLPCATGNGDETALVGAIETANNVAGPDTIVLASDCLYSFTSAYTALPAFTNWYGPAALPAIASTIAIEGNGATIERSPSATAPFRLFYIGADPSDPDTSGYTTPGPGVLTLRDLTLRGGLAQGGTGGSGGGGGAGLGGTIFNQGSLTLERSTDYGSLARGGAGGPVNGPPNGGGGGIGTDAVGGVGGGFGAGTFGGSSGGPSDTVNVGGGGGGGFRLSENGSGSTLDTGGAGGGPQTGTGGTGGAGGGGGAGGNGAGGGGGGSGTDPSGSFTGGAGGAFGSGGLDGFIDGEGGGGGVGGGGGGGIAGGGGGFGGGGGASLSVAGGPGGFGGGGGPGTADAGGNGGFGGGDGGLGATAIGGGGAGMGGAVFNHQGELTVINSTLSGNAATGGTGAQAGEGLGGALFNLNGFVTLDSATIAGNTADNGGALYNLGYLADDSGDPGGHDYTARVTLTNSILSDSIGGDDLVSNAPATVAGGAANTVDDANDTEVSAAGPNLVETRSMTGAGEIDGSPLTADPQLGPLAENGGTTETQALGATSPARDAGATAEATDQRGITRPQGPNDDIGAFEFERPGVDLALTLTDAPDPVTEGENITYTVTATSSGPIDATGVKATDALPVGVSFVSAGTSPACANTAGTVTCDFGALASGASESAVIVVRANAVGTIANTATVAGEDPDPNHANDSAITQTTVNARPMPTQPDPTPEPVVPTPEPPTPPALLRRSSTSSRRKRFLPSTARRRSASTSARMSPARRSSARSTRGRSSRALHRFEPNSSRVGTSSASARSRRPGQTPSRPSTASRSFVGARRTRAPRGVMPFASVAGARARWRRRHAADRHAAHRPSAGGR